MKSLSAKLIVLIGIILLVVCSALAFISYYYSSNSVVNEVNKSLMQLAETGTKIVTAEVKAQINALEVLAKDRTIQNPDIPLDEKLLLLREEAERAGHITMGIADPGGLLTTCDKNYYILSMYPFFDDLLQGTPVVSDPMMDKGYMGLIMMFAVPIYHEGQVSGILVAIRSGDFLSTLMEQLAFGESGTAFMINSEGTAIANNDLSMVKYGDNVIENAENDPELAEFAELQRKMAAGETGVGSYTYQGDHKYLGYAPVEGTSWSLGVTALEEEIMAGVKQLQIVILTASVVILGVGVIFVVLLSRRMIRPLKDAVVKVQEVAQGNLAIESLQVKTKDEIGTLGESINKMLTSLRTLVGNISAIGSQIAASSEELSASSEQQAKAANEISATISDMAQGAEKQAEALDSISDAVREATAAIEQIAANSTKLVEESNQAAAAAGQGQEAAKRAIAQMQNIRTGSSKVQEAIDKLALSSNEIDKITHIIADIAEQTNLLALNAAIEAARAGEHGRGFAVVAEEVRKLAEQSQTAAKQIADLIAHNRVNIDEAVASMEDNGKQIQTGIDVVENAGRTFARIYELTNKSSQLMQEISDAVQQLAENSQVIADRIKDIDSISKETAASAQNASAATEEQTASVEEIASASQSLAIMAQELQDSIREFKM